MKKHINALLGFVCYTIGVIAAAYYGVSHELIGNVSKYLDDYLLDIYNDFKSKIKNWKEN